MIALALAAAAAEPADAASLGSALQLCRTALSKRLGSDVQAIDADSSNVSHGWTVIRGPMIAFIGMGEPRPGEVKAPHLIRAEYDFICWVNSNQVKKITVNRIR